ncbi:MAG: hypothetical protein GY727_13375 [Gammaproteobacteria bacterium]|nr:hypothetical protein [Gammaproteobacteria bacterium]MCP4088276.1 hypothetical protein [Gammaproteobacteria bacterium]MCP4276413.1 hypothetical protein [Gammaproteobacteria bacterium]MCP4831060.1 hypothetical protein [Gammaproteobacteria bacterium]MCP4929328.1 hypothetical protein [Gammaproteobacteria bacterium]
MPDNDKLTEAITLCHQGLDEYFLLHQEAVLLGKFDDASQILNCFKVLHNLHMRFEDELLIPKLTDLGDKGRWPAFLYTAEHAKIQELLEKTTRNLQLLSNKQLEGNSLRRSIIAFLDNEKVFKGVCEHHQEREEAGILPELNKQTDKTWRRSIIKPFLNEWERCMEQNMQVINKIDWL